MRFSIFSTPKEKMVAVLSLLSLLALARFFSTDLLLRLITLILAMLVFEYLLWKLRGITPFRPTAGAVSALIIFLLASKTSILLSLFALLVAVAQKQFLRPGGNHIFNPAASGLLLASFFGLPVTWWGVSWGTAPLLATIFGAGYVSLYAIRQHRVILPYLLTSLVVSFLLISHSAAFNQLLGGSFWFFALVMLPEPMTAAKKPSTRPVYGSLVALLPFLLGRLLPADPLLISLLAGNAFARTIERR